MQWLEQAVQRHGYVDHPLTAAEYKVIYLQQLMKTVQQRITQVDTGRVPAEAHMVAGAKPFLNELSERGARLYAASGTDHADVVHEAQVLGLAPFFTGGIFGALDEIEAHSKERIIQRILDENQLSGDALVVVGDGPVELREAHTRRAIALGVASDEIARNGWNRRKVNRLVEANADLLVADFDRHAELTDLLFGQ